MNASLTLACRHDGDKNGDKKTQIPAHGNLCLWIRYKCTPQMSNIAFRCQYEGI